MSTPTIASPRHLSATSEALMAMTDSVRQFGFGALIDGLSQETLAALQAEADATLGNMVEAESAANLKYRARMGSLGPIAKAVLNSEEMTGLLTRVFGGHFAISDHISCYTHYASSDHLGAHLDKPAKDCAVTILIYVRAASPAPNAADTGLVLRVYGETEDTIGSPRLSIPTAEGTVALGHGSRFWHERPALQPGENVVAITGCYRSVDE